MQEIFIDTLDGNKLSAYLWQPGAGDKCMVVVCHGFRGTKENGGKIFAFADKLKQAGAGVAAFDFQGSGRSEGDFAAVTLSRQGEDLQAVIDYVDRSFGLPVILLGRSMGGSSILVGGATDQRVAGYVFWSTPVFMHQAFATIMGDYYEHLRAGEKIVYKDDGGEFELQPDLLRDFDQHDMEQLVRSIGARPTLIIQARDDESVGADNGEYLHRLLPHSQLLLFEQGGHRFLELTAEREDSTIAWLRESFCG